MYIGWSPGGIAVTIGIDFASINVMNHGEETHIRKLTSDWEITNGEYQIKDVALSIQENRIAAKSWININTDD
ncbi:MAG: hypothetical protein BMS9Abin39_0388 [Ignavibacteria bacterium]|nr:MAG: hypothetical protein BMS9Abin39_0388 [Ignavibacteria bacterium]